MNKFYAAMCFLLLCCIGLQFYYFRSPERPKASGLAFDDVDIRFTGPIKMDFEPIQSPNGSLMYFYETPNYFVTVSAYRRETK